MQSAAILLGVALGAPRDAHLPRLESPLRQAWHRHQKDMPQLLAHAMPEIAGAEGIQVTVELAGVPDLFDASRIGGWEVHSIARTGADTVWALLEVAWSDLAALESLPGLRRARLPHVAREKRDPEARGEIVSEGLEAIFRDGDWLAAGIDGRRVDVAVVDVGFLDATGRNAAELPRRTRIRHRPESDASAHGTAVAEVIHDLSPRVRIRLEPFTTGVEFLSLMTSLGEGPGIELVNGSIGFDNIWPADGTSPYTRAVDRLSSAGALWVGAAGNEGGRYLAGALHANDGGLTIAGEPGAWVDVTQGTVEAVLRWSEPMEGANVDLDLRAYTVDGVPCGQADDPQDGGHSVPLETLVAACPGAQAWVEVVVDDPDDLPEGLTGWLYAPQGLTPARVDAGIGILTLPGDNRTGITVGACDRDANAAPPYSSWGPTEDGRTKPDLCAPDGVSTATYGAAGFIGTSAAAPHATGFAALIAHANGLRGQPERLREAVMQHAVDLGEPGHDATFGAGALDAGPAPEGCHCMAHPHRQGAQMVALALVLALARRRPRGDTGCAALPLRDIPLAHGIARDNPARLHAESATNAV